MCGYNNIKSTKKTTTCSTNRSTLDPHAKSNATLYTPGHYILPVALLQTYIHTHTYTRKYILPHQTGAGELRVNQKLNVIK